MSFRPLSMLFAMSILLPPQLNGQERQGQGDNPAAILMSGAWEGTWITFSPESTGYVFLAELDLKVDGNNAAEGKITWTLKETPQDSLIADKIGKTAVEHVKGTLHPASRTLRFDGYEKDDPDEIIALDKYSLILAENNKVLGGITSSHETWQGLISLKLKNKD